MHRRRIRLGGRRIRRDKIWLRPTPDVLGASRGSCLLVWPCTISPKAWPWPLRRCIRLIWALPLPWPLGTFDSEPMNGECGEALSGSISFLPHQQNLFSQFLHNSLHNIPEGIAIAIPCLAARPDSPWLAFGLASLSGLTEPLGAIVALTVLQVDMESMGNWLAFVASIMIAVAVAELFPEAWRNAVADDAKAAFWMGAVVGFVIMVGSDAVLDQSLEES